MIPIVSIVGRSNSGKTTLLEKLIRTLVARGWRIGTIKHHFHGPVQVDVPGKDSWRHRQAGARAVALSSAQTFFVVRDTDGELPLETIAHLALFGVDGILTEGFKSGPMPKIEVNRDGPEVPLLCGPDDHLVAVVSAQDRGAPVPHFDPEDVSSLADFIEREFLKVSQPSQVDVLLGGRRVSLDGQTQEVLARVIRCLVGDSRDPGSGPPIEIRVHERTP
ncbi:MAG TPA: molybdopterin-guanine dinucleotide biosynthesis protein B [Candidatus Methylomirabilis sp.]|nr:molybdopterin-guanine dinucleotide biosynthesis protein B [Candidatus Methylomirabilis sp.]